MIINKSRQKNNTLQWHFSPRWPGDIHNDLVANNVLPFAPPFGQVKSCLINEEELCDETWHVSGIKLKCSLPNGVITYCFYCRNTVNYWNTLGKVGLYSWNTVHNPKIIGWQLNSTYLKWWSLNLWIRFKRIQVWLVSLVFFCIEGCDQCLLC